MNDFFSFVCFCTIKLNSGAQFIIVRIAEIHIHIVARMNMHRDYQSTLNLACFLSNIAYACSLICGICTKFLQSFFYTHTLTDTHTHTLVL